MTQAPRVVADPPELLAYTEHQQLRNLSPVTIRARAQLVRLLAAWLGERSLASARLADLRAFVASRRDQLANSSQACEISYLKAFYAALLELGLVEVNPAAGLKSWRPRSTSRPMSLLCVRSLLLEASRIHGTSTRRRQALALRDRACLELLFATGMRASEIVSARAVDVDLEAALVLVRRAKRGPSRRLPLPRGTVEALKVYLCEGRAVLLADHDDPGHLFLGQDGAGLGKVGLGLLVGRVARRCQVRAYPHVFRRTLATELARAGVSLPAIQKVLGHAQLTITADYVDVRLDQMRVALEEFVRLRPKSHAVQAPEYLQRRLFHCRQAFAA